MHGYTHLTSDALRSGNTRQTVAWDAAFKDIELVDTWFIEDDVAATERSWQTLFDVATEFDEELLTTHFSDDVNANQKWHHYDAVKQYFKFPYISQNQICRCKKSLIEKVLSFRQRHNRFVFHEALLASLAKSRYDLSCDNRLDFSDFNWVCDKPNFERIDEHCSLYHPIKDSGLHKLISNYK